MKWVLAGTVVGLGIVMAWVAWSRNQKSPVDNGPSLPEVRTPAISAESFRDVHSWHPRTWYNDCLWGGGRVSSDGRYIAFPNEEEILLLDVEENRVTALKDELGWEHVGYTRWYPGSHCLSLSGRLRGEALERQYDLDTKSITTLNLLTSTYDSLPTSRPDRYVAIGEHDDDAGIFLVDTSGDVATQCRLLVSKVFPRSWTVSQSANQIAYMVQERSGLMTLSVVDIDSGSNRRVAENLDTSYQMIPIYFAPDDSEVLLSLVGPVAAPITERQRPDADRDLDIYAIDVNTGAIRPIVIEAGDDLGSGFVRNAFFWTNQTTSMRTGIVSIDGGKVEPLLGEQTSYPSWHPSGRKIGVMYGEWNLADWALNWDLGVVEVDADGHAVSAMKPEVTGNHEDFGPAWSPDGQWLAYHSHRATRPGANYRTPYSTDDIWVRRAEGGPESRLTNHVGFEVCQPDWSPDGKRIVFIAAKPRVGYRPVILDFDPTTGKALSTQDFMVPDIKHDVISANWSPNGRQLALEEQSSGGHRTLWLVNVDSMEKEKLAEYQSLTELSATDFTPDGDFIVYTALVGDHHQLFKVGTSPGAEPVQLTHGSEEVYAPQVSPDGRFVALTVYTHTKTVKSAEIAD